MERFFRPAVIWLPLALWWSAAPVWATNGDAAAGKPLYERHCAGCHGAQGKGEAPFGQALIPPAADLTSAKTKKRLRAVLSNMIEHGKPGTEMAAWKGRLAEREIADVVAYLRALGSPAP
nr:cytochrome c [Nitrospirota bacterium]